MICRSPPWLPHAGQLRIGEPRGVRVVEADDRDVVGNAAARGSQRPHRSDRHEVARSKHRVEVGDPREQRAHRDLSAVFGKVPVFDDATPRFRSAGGSASRKPSRRSMPTGMSTGPAMW